MIKRPFSYYDDLVEIGYHNTIFRNDSVPLVALIVPPACFMGGGLMVFFMELSFYLDDVEMWEEGLYYLDEKPVFPFAGIFLPVFMFTIGLILLIFFLTLNHQFKTGTREKVCIRYSAYNMHFVIGARGEKEMTVIPTYLIRHVSAKVNGNTGVGKITISYLDDEKMKKHTIKNVYRAQYVGELICQIVNGGDY